MNASMTVSVPSPSEKIYFFGSKGILLWLAALMICVVNYGQENCNNA
jgi:hypothetical protein